MAVALVVAHHVAPGLLPGGFVGVDVFFVISGYLITGILDTSIRSGTFRYTEFLWRRCRRIIPALAVTLLGTLVLGLCVLTGPELMALARHTIAAAASLSNVLLWSEVGYFDTAASTKPLLHLWSLGVEEQFYLLWPVLLLLLPRRRRPRVLIVACLAMVSLVVSESLAWTAAPQAFYLLHSRAWELAAGGLLAMAPPWRRVLQLSPERATPLREVFSIAGAGLIAVSASLNMARDTWPGFNAVLPVLGTLLVIAAGPGAALNRTVLSAPVALWLGKRSYPLYLWHWPPLALLHVIGTEHGWQAGTAQTAALMTVPLTVWLAHATFQWVERPVQRRAVIQAATGTFTPWRLLPFAASLLCVALLSRGLIAANGLPERYSDSAGDATTLLRAASPDSIVSYTARAQRCPLEDSGTATWCWRVPGSGRGIAVFGDSHAEVIFAGLTDKWLGVPLLLTGRKGCAPVLNRAPIGDRLAEICRKATLLAHDAIQTDTSIGTVLLVSRGPAYLSGYALGIDSLKPLVPLVAGSAPDTIAQTLAYERGIARTVRSLQGAGKRVVLVLDVPELGFDPQECVIGRPFRLRVVRRPCAVTRVRVERRNARYRALAAGLQRQLPGLELFDAAAPLCDEEYCHAQRGDDLLYSDANHLTIAGTRLVTAKLVPMLLPSRERVASTAPPR